jgi:hypothetical protein
VIVSLFSTASGLLVAQNASPTTRKADPAKRAEAWRSSLPSFADEVVAVATRSEVPSASVQITHIREYTVFTNKEGEDFWVVFKQGFGKELHGELANRFAGQVSWVGQVESVKSDTEKKTRTIEIMLPAPSGMKAPLELAKTVTLTIPDAKLPEGSLPAKGSMFAFRAQLKKDDADTVFTSPVWVLYGLGSNSGKVEIHVTLSDVEPIFTRHP